MTDYAAQFSLMYDQNPDPWNYAKSPYEQSKYDATCAALLSASYKSGIEVGCSVGVLSARLAQRCKSFLAVDIAPGAVRQASQRLATIPGAKARLAKVPQDWPQQQFDLIVLSEVLYYMTAAELVSLAENIAASAVPGAECVLVNWRGATEAESTGPAACHVFCESLKAFSNTTQIIHPGTDRYDHITLVLNQTSAATGFRPRA